MRPEELKEKWSAILNSTTNSDCRAMLIEPMTSTCTCSYIKIGTTVSDTKNLNPECPEHGYDSVWYNSPEQVKRREERTQRLRELYDARRKAQEKLND